MSPEALYQIGVRSGILDEKHRKALGYSGLWLFGFLILKQNREGKVNYGRPLTYREISKGSGIPKKSLERIFPRVVLKNDYFEAERTRDGYKITGVKKQKKFLDQDVTRAAGNISTAAREEAINADVQPAQQPTRLTRRERNLATMQKVADSFRVV